MIGFVHGDNNRKCLNELKRLVSEYNLTAEVHLIEHDTETDRLVKSIISKSDCLLHTSLMEGRGIVVFESMIRGVPVIAMDAYGVPDTVIHGVNGLLVSPHTEDAFARQVLNFMENEELRVNLTALTSVSVKRNYDQKKLYDNLLDL